MRGKVSIRAVVVNDTEPAIETTLPNGSAFALGLREQLAYCFSSLQMMRGMFVTQEEFDTAVFEAQARVTATPQGPVQ